MSAHPAQVPFDESDPDWNTLGGPQQIQQAWQTLAGGAPTAARALIHIARHGKSEVARVQAAQAILDRVGLATRPDTVVQVIPSQFVETTDIGPSPVDQIRERLAVLAQAGNQTVEGTVIQPDD